MSAPSSTGLRIRWVDIDRGGAGLVDKGRAHRINAPAELRRAARMPDPGRRDGFLASRVALRLILEELAATRWFGLDFAETANGKPYLPGLPVHFSLSRTDGLAVVALFDGPVGVDVERERLLDASTRSEVRRVSRNSSVSPQSGGPAASDMRMWTELEAAIKLRDGRLAERFGSWNSGGPNGRANLADPDYFDMTAIHLDLPLGYVGTCCVTGAPGAVDCAEWRLADSPAPPKSAPRSKAPAAA